MKLTRTKRMATHAILIAASALFLFPFVWLVTTSVKPIEQTMKMPPDWVPSAFYATVQGDRMKVVRQRVVEPASAIVHIEDGLRRGERVLAPLSKIKDGKAEVTVRVGAREEVRSVTATIEKTIPAAQWTLNAVGWVWKWPGRLRVKVDATPEGHRLVREKLELLPHEQGVWELSVGHVRDWAALQRPFAAGDDVSTQTRPVARFRDLLDPAARALLARGDALSDAEKSDVVAAFNQVLSRKDVDGTGAFDEVGLPLEAREFAGRARERLDDKKTGRLNRLLLEAAFPAALTDTTYQRLEPRWDVVAPEEIEERTELAWHNYEGAIKYTGLHTVHILGSRFQAPMFLVYFYNTLFVAVLGAAGTVLSSALAAYGFSRITWRGRNVLFGICLSTMMVPFAVTMVPLYGVFRSLGWIGTLKPLWVPACFGGAFQIFLLRQFFLTIPQDLSDAARIDGCGEFAIFWRIFLPLSKPALAVVALFHFMWAWKDFMGPLIYLTEKSTFTLSLGLFTYQSQHGGSEWHYLMAASTLMILPVILLFFFTQRTFIQGISTTGMKG